MNEQDLRQLLKKCKASAAFTRDAIAVFFIGGIGAVLLLIERSHIPEDGKSRYREFKDYVTKRTKK